jgi:hypothetical protein
VRFAGQTIEVCANTLDADNCLGTESCVTVTFPTLNGCRLDQVSSINIIKDNDGCPIELDPNSLVTKPHYWTYSSQNGSDLLGTCVHNPQVSYSPEAEYLGDVLDVCVTVMGMQNGIPCTTQTCTTVVLPPKYTFCSGGLQQAPFFHNLGKLTGANPKYKVDLEARSHIFTPLYEHIWLIRDNVSGKESAVFGENVELIEGVHFDRQDRLTDLKVCHVIRNKLGDCIIGVECEDFSYNCDYVSWLRFQNINFDPSRQEFVIQYRIIQSVYDHETDVFIDKALGSSFYNTSALSYTVRVPALAPCGTALIELQVTLTLGEDGVSFCSYISDKFTYGPQPCLHNNPPGIHPPYPLENAME